MECVQHIELLLSLQCWSLLIRPSVFAGRCSLKGDSHSPQRLGDKGPIFLGDYIPRDVSQVLEKDNSAVKLAKTLNRFSSQRVREIISIFQKFESF